MGRRLLPEFFTPEELSTSTCVPSKPGRVERPQANKEKLEHLLSKCTVDLLLKSQIIYTDEVKVFPGGFEVATMLSKLNQGFIDYRNKRSKPEL